MTCSFTSRRYPTCRSSRQTGTGVTDIAVGDMVGGRHDDIVLSDEGGRLWLHRGTRDALANAATITQGSRGVPGSDETGDEFGASLVAAEVGGSAKADLIVGAPGEDDGSGRVTVLFGHRAGLGHAGGRVLSQDTPGIPNRNDRGDAFGTAVSALDVDGDDDLDAVVGAPGENGGRGAITVVPSHDGRLATGRAVRIALSDVTPDSYYYSGDDNQALGATIGR